MYGPVTYGDENEKGQSVPRLHRLWWLVHPPACQYIARGRSGFNSQPKRFPAYPLHPLLASALFAHGDLRSLLDLPSCLDMKRH